VVFVSIAFFSVSDNTCSGDDCLFVNIYRLPPKLARFILQAPLGEHDLKRETAKEAWF
jgi:hypothetical protein